MPIFGVVRHIHKMSAVEMWMLKWMYDHARLDEIKSTFLEGASSIHSGQKERRSLEMVWSYHAPTFR